MSASSSILNEKHEISLPPIRLEDKQTKEAINTRKSSLSEPIESIEAGNEVNLQARSEEESLSSLLEYFLLPNTKAKTQASNLSEQVEEKVEESDVTVIPPEQSTPLDPQEQGLAEIMDLRKRHSLSSLIQDL
jgi:hypothetical protein